MTRKDYQRIAQVISDYDFRVHDPLLGEVVADVLQESFENFDRTQFEKFIAARTAGTQRKVAHVGRNLP